jgi:hypothetical protein
MNTDEVDFGAGTSIRHIADGAILKGHMDGEEAILVRRGSNFFAVGGRCIRVEYWVVAQRQGQVAARNILGFREPFACVPFFWSQHYDVTINYVGHAESYDAVSIDGALESRDCAVTYSRGGRTLAVATLSRDLQSLRAEQSLEAARPGSPRA